MIKIDINDLDKYFQKGELIPAITCIEAKNGSLPSFPNSVSALFGTKKPNTTEALKALFNPANPSVI